MAKGFEINKSVIRKMTRDLRREFDKHPIKVPVETDQPHVSGYFTSPATTINNYNGPVVHIEGDHAQLAWNNDSVTQNQNRVEDIAAGYEELAQVLTSLLAGLNALGLSASDDTELRENVETVLGEVTNAEPNQGVIKRSVTMLKGLLAAVAAGVSAGVSAESQEFARTIIDALGNSAPS